MNTQEHLNLIIKNGYPLPSIVDTSDCALPWENEFPEFMLLSDDDGNMWEFLNGKLVGQTSIHFSGLMPHFEGKSEAGMVKAMKELMRSGKIDKMQRGGAEMIDAVWRSSEADWNTNFITKWPGAVEARNARRESRNDFFRNVGKIVIDGKFNGESEDTMGMKIWKLFK